MPQDIYSIAALACRYWFVFLGVLIVWRSFAWLFKDRSQKHRRLKTLPDAGMIGELVVLQGSDELPEDSYLPVPREGTLGSLRVCDLVVPVSGVAKQHIDFVFISGQGIRMTPRYGCSCMVDGELIANKHAAAQFPMQHNSLLSVGDALLKLRLFAGVDAPYQAEFMPDDWDGQQPAPDESMPQYDPRYPPYPPQNAPYSSPAAWQQPAYPPYQEMGEQASPPHASAYPSHSADQVNRGYHDEA